MSLINVCVCCQHVMTSWTGHLLGLRKVYQASSGAKVAVRNLSFGLSKGQCFGFLGINGAGKTSTLNMLTGAVLPSSGDAWLAGKHILTEQKEVRRLIGYCPQHDALLDLLSVREHLELFGRIKGEWRVEYRLVHSSQASALYLFTLC